MGESTVPARGTLREVAGLFLRLGFTAFGGPAAHTAMMEDEVVRRRGWLSAAEFLDLVGATNLIPGPNSTELAIHIGHRRAGWPGLVVAGLGFTLPAVAIVTALAWAYVEFGARPQAQAWMDGVRPVILAVVAQAVWRLGRRALTSRLLAGLAGAGVAASLAGVGELVLLFAGGAVVLAARARSAGAAAAATAGLAAPASAASSAAAAATTAAATTAAGATATTAAATMAAGAAATVAASSPFGLWPLFLFFLKVGSVLYGSGYVLLAFLRADLVDRWGWLTEAQLLDAVAIGQFTPGPLFTTATFIGYVLAGLPGAGLATAGIFLPSFFFVAVSGPLVPRLRRSPRAGACLDGVNAASLALMAAVTWQLGWSCLRDPVSLALAVLAWVLLVRYRVNSAWLVLGGGVAGVAVSAAGLTL